MPHGEVKPVVRRTVMREDLKEYILGAILSGELQPGQHIKELHLTRKLGVSQAPIREALIELEQMGVVKNEPFRGTFVRSLSAQELQDMYSVRALLEGYAARLAVQFLDAAAVALLEGLIGEMLDAARAREPQRMVEADVAFHETLVHLSGNSSLVHLWRMIRPATWTLLTASRAGAPLEYLAGRHQQVMEALKSGDPDQAAAAMVQHIEDLAQHVIRQAETSRTEGQGSAP